MSSDPLRPHPMLERYYGSDPERAAVVNHLFDEGAPHYEWICRIMSFGTGETYRRQALRNSGLEPGMRVLDVATGTGLVLRAASDISGDAGLAVGLDPMVARFGTGAQAASRMMDYFWDTIETCVPPDVILDALRDAGFPDATRRVTGGILSEYLGEKPRP